MDKKWISTPTTLLKKRRCTFCFYKKFENKPEIFTELKCLGLDFYGIKSFSNFECEGSLGYKM